MIYFLNLLTDEGIESLLHKVRSRLRVVVNLIESHTDSRDIVWTQRLDYDDFLFGELDR